MWPHSLPASSSPSGASRTYEALRAPPASAAQAVLVEALADVANAPPPPVPPRADPVLLRPLPPTPMQQTLEALMQARWGSVIDVLAHRPSTHHPKPAVWMSKHHAGEFGVFIPARGRPLVVKTLEMAEARFTEAGYRPGMSDAGPRTSVGGTMPAAFRGKLEQQQGVAITPLVVRGLEIAYHVSKDGHRDPTVLLCAERGNACGSFLKPPGIEIAFADPRLVGPGVELEFAAGLQDATASLDPVQFGYGVEEIADYPVKAIGLPVDDVAAFVGGAGSDGPRFGIAWLNPQARHVTLSDLVESLAPSLGMEPNRLVCHLVPDRRP